MSLPKQEHPLYTITLPLSKTKHKFRPFLVKEEKILLMAMESDEEESIVDAIKQIITNCCVNDIDVDDLPIIDIEYFFLNIQARSVSEISEFQYKCNNIISEDKVCGNVVKFKLNLLEIVPEISKDFTHKIELTSTLGLMMKVPNFRMLEESNSDDKESTFKQISSCIEYIYDMDKIFYTKDYTQDEMNEWLGDLNRNQILKIEKFFSSIPKLEKNIDFCCDKCGYTEKIHIEGLHNFFV